MPAAIRAALRFGQRFAWIAVLAVLVAVVAYARVWRPVRASPVHVERGAIEEEAFGRGTVESQREAAVGFDLAGRLSTILVDEGDRVTLGQELARLETDQAEADLQSARTGIAAARATLVRLAAEEERARAVLATAEREAARTRSLRDAGAIPGKDDDDAGDRVRVARAELDRVLAQRAEATRGIDVASGGAEQRRVAMVRATLLAPFDGLVTRRMREPGDTVTVGTTVLRVVDTGRVYVKAAVDETVLPKLQIGQRATIEFPVGSTPVAGKVTRIGWESDRQTHEISVEVTPDALERRIAIGQRADVHVQLARKADVVRIPLDVVHRDATGVFVYVDRGGRIAIARPHLGIAGPTHVEVLDGISETDTLLSPPEISGTLPAGRRWTAP